MSWRIAKICSQSTRRRFRGIKKGCEYKKSIKHKLDQTAAAADTDAHHLLGKAKSYMKDVDSYL